MLTKEILSLQHPIVKHLVHLRKSKAYRDEQGTLLITGRNVLEELSKSRRFKRVLLEKGSSASFSYNAEETLFVSKEILSKITGLVSAEEIVAEIEKPPSSDLSHKRRVLVLDRIADPGNLGTLLRTALGFGWDGVFLLEGSVDLFNDKALRASKGAIFSLPFSYGDEKSLEFLLSKQSWTLLAADPRGDDSSTFASLPSPLLLAIGNESQGLSPFIVSRFTSISLPMNKKMQSLNAAVAGGILLYLLQGPRHE